MRRTMTNKQLALCLGAAGAAIWLVRRASSTCSVRGKVVLITGGSRGLGLVLARHLADEGAHLAICARDADELDRAADDLGRHGTVVQTLPCNLTDKDQVHHMISEVRSRLGP